MSQPPLASQSAALIANRPNNLLPPRIMQPMKRFRCPAAGSFIFLYRICRRSRQQSKFCLYMRLALEFSFKNLTLRLAPPAGQPLRSAHFAPRSPAGARSRPWQLQLVSARRCTAPRRDILYSTAWEGGFHQKFRHAPPLLQLSGRRRRIVAHGAEKPGARIFPKPLDSADRGA